jgi:hypothetical protein
VSAAGIDFVVGDGGGTAIIFIRGDRERTEGMSQTTGSLANGSGNCSSCRA